MSAAVTYLRPMGKLTVYLVQDVDNGDRPAVGRIIVNDRRWQPLFSPKADPVRSGAFGFAAGQVAKRGGMPSRQWLYRNLIRELAEVGLTITQTVEIDNLSVEDAREMTMNELRKLIEFRKELAEEIDLS